MSRNIRCLIRPISAVLLVAGLSSAMASQQVFNPDYCLPSGTNTDGMSVTDVTFKSGTQNSVNASDCYGEMEGNITGTTGIGGSSGFVPWVDSKFAWKYLVGGSGGTQGVYESLTFSLAITGTGTDGTFALTWVDGAGGINLPVALDFALALKASNGYGLYFFDDLYLQADPNNSGTGTWKISFDNNGGQIPDLSHMELFVRGGAPEPASLALIASGLISLVAVRRRWQ